MFFHGTLGQAHGLGDLGVLAPVNAIKQKDLPRTLGQGAQCCFDVAKIIAGFECGLGFTGVAVGFVRLPAFADPRARSFAAQNDRWRCCRRSAADKC